MNSSNALEELWGTRYKNIKSSKTS